MKKRTINVPNILHPITVCLVVEFFFPDDETDHHKDVLPVIVKDITEPLFKISFSTENKKGQGWYLVAYWCHSRKKFRSIEDVESFKKEFLTPNLLHPKDYFSDLQHIDVLFED